MKRMMRVRVYVLSMLLHLTIAKYVVLPVPIPKNNNINNGIINCSIFQSFHSKKETEIEVCQKEINSCGLDLEISRHTF
jgi:hypothetical protein